MKIRFALFFATAVAVAATYAQTSTPIVIQAMTPAQSAASQPIAATQTTNNAASAITALQALKAENVQILQKQAAVLQQLEEMEKAAEQIKIYTKRG